MKKTRNDQWHIVCTVIVTVVLIVLFLAVELLWRMFDVRINYVKPFLDENVLLYNWIAEIWRVLADPSNVFSLFSCQFSLTLTVITLVTVLSSGGENLYWEDLTYRNLVKPAGKSLYAMTIKSYIALLGISAFAMVLKLYALFYIGFMYNVYLLIKISYKMLSIYFNRDKQKKILVEEFVSEKNAEEKQKMLDALFEKTMYALNEKKYSEVVENVCFLVGQIKQDDTNSIQKENEDIKQSQSNNDNVKKSKSCLYNIFSAVVEENVALFNQLYRENECDLQQCMDEERLMIIQKTAAKSAMQRGYIDVSINMCGDDVEVLFNEGNKIYKERMLELAFDKIVKQIDDASEDKIEEIEAQISELINKRKNAYIEAKEEYAKWQNKLDLWKSEEDGDFDKIAEQCEISLQKESENKEAWNDVCSLVTVKEGLGKICNALGTNLLSEDKIENYVTRVDTKRAKRILELMLEDKNIGKCFETCINENMSKLQKEIFNGVSFGLWNDCWKEIQFLDDNVVSEYFLVGENTNKLAKFLTEFLVYGNLLFSINSMISEDMYENFKVSQWCAGDLTNYNMFTIWRAVLKEIDPVKWSEL